MIRRLLQRATDQVIAAHPDETVLRTALLSAESVARRRRGSVVVVTASGDGLSFRDPADREVLRIAAGDILSLELAPHGRAIRPAVVATLDGPVEFFIGATPDQQVDAIVALRQALGRPLG